ncbi:MAG: cyclic nucleotide-binding domain-containing protein [Spirochaetaceae bacterium]
MKISEDLLYIRKGEGSLVFRFFLQYFLIGIPRLFTFTGAGALFLQYFKSDYLPIVQMATALILPFIGILLFLFQKRGQTKRLFSIMYFLLIVALVIFRIIFHYNKESPYPYAFLLIWANVEYAITEIIFWISANRMFNIRQAKRLFGVIAAGEVLSIIIMGSLLSQIVKFISPQNLILLSALSLFFALLNHQKIHFPKPIIETPKRFIKKTEYPKYYILLLFLIVLLENNTHIIGENIFFRAIEEKFVSTTSIIVFMGAFMAVLNILKFIFQLFLTNRFNEKFGVLGALLSPILFLIPVSIGIAIFSLNAQYIQVVILFALLLRIFISLSIGSFYGPVFFTLFQPLRDNIREKIQNIADSVIGQGAGFLGGGAILFLGSIIGISFLNLSVILILNLCLWLFVIIIIFKEFNKQLVFHVLPVYKSKNRIIDSKTNIETDELLREKEQDIEIWINSYILGDVENNLRNLLQLSDLKKKTLDILGQYLTNEILLCNTFDFILSKLIQRPETFLIDNLRDEKVISQRRILLVVSILEKNVRIFDINRQLNSENSKTASFAIELIEQWITGKYKRKIIEIVEPPYQGFQNKQLIKFLRSCENRDDFSHLLSYFSSFYKSDAGKWMLYCFKNYLIDDKDKLPWDFEKTKILKKNEVFGKSSCFDLSKAADYFNEESYVAKELIIKKGEIGDTMYIIIEGTVKVFVGNIEYALLAEGSFFGEGSALSPEPRSASISAVSDVKLLSINKKYLYSLLEDYPQILLSLMLVLCSWIRTNVKKIDFKEVVKVNDYNISYSEYSPSVLLSKMRSIPELKNIKDDLFKSLIYNSSILNIKSGQRLYNRGDSEQTPFFLIEGEMKFFLNTELEARLQTNGFFGLLSTIDNGEYIEHAEAVKDCTILVIKPEIFGFHLSSNYYFGRYCLTKVMNKLRFINTIIRNK